MYLIVVHGYHAVFRTLVAIKNGDVIQINVREYGLERLGRKKPVFVVYDAGIFSICHNKAIDTCQIVLHDEVTRT